MDRPCLPLDANLAKIAAGGPVEVLNTFNRFFNNQRGIFPKGCGKPQTFPISTFFPQYKMDYPQPPNPHSHRILRAFPQNSRPLLLLLSRFLSLQSKINSAPQKAHPSRENFLPSLPIKTDKKLSTPAKQVVRAGLQSPTRAEAPAQVLISGRPEPAKSCPGPGNFRYQRVKRNKNPYCLVWTFIAENGTQNLASLFHITKSDRKTTPASIFHSP